jgi:membrane-associated phospholipid phosphatase
MAARARLAIGMIGALLAAPSLAFAQALPVDRLTPALPTAGGQRVADVASWITAGALVGVESWDAWHDEHRPRAVGLEAARLGLTYAGAFTVKKLVSRERPCAPSCGIDNPSFSFWSAHAAVACQALDRNRLKLSIALAVATIAGRVLGNKHWLTDTLAGCGAGALASLLR